MNTAKREPPTYGEMVTAESARKRNSLYRAESMALNDEKIKNIMAATTAQLEALSKVDRKLSLRDTEDIKQRSLLYMRACTEAGTTPTFAGLCRAFGYTRQAVEHFVKTNPKHDTTEWLTLVRDAISESLADAALRGCVQPIVSIFVLKSRGGWHENDITALDTLDTEHGTHMTAEQISEKYEGLLPE